MSFSRATSPVLLLFGLALACSSEGIVDDREPDGCAPTSCAELGAQCGVQSDGCGGTVDCGGCPADQICGGAGPHRCGPGECAEGAAEACGDGVDQDCDGAVDEGCEPDGGVPAPDAGGCLGDCGISMCPDGDRLVELMNEHRARGVSCAGVTHPPAPPLRFDAQVTPRLENAARRHARDMDELGLRDHYSSAGYGFVERIRLENRGYDFGWRFLNESLASGVRTPEAVVEAWLSSDRYCAAMMNPDAVYAGVACQSGHWVVLTADVHADTVFAHSEPAEAWKRELLAAINQRRAAGATCGGTDFVPIAPARYNVHIEAAAMAHAMDMYYTGVDGDRGSDGSNIQDRLQNLLPTADVFPYFSARNQAEAAGVTSVAEAMDAWMADPGDCLGIMVQEERWVGFARYRDNWVAVILTPAG
jgi:uncharacterized protein YkwD